MIVTTRGVRDAVDAFVQQTNERRRTAKSCGPGAATLALSFAGSFPQVTVANKPAHRGEHEVNRKAIAQGMSDCPRSPVCSCAPFLALFAYETAGAACTRHSLRPLFAEEQTNLQKLGRKRAARSLIYALGPRPGLL